MMPSRALAVALPLVALACGRSPSKLECNALLDRYMEKLVGNDRPGTSAAELSDLKRRARAKAATDPAFLECEVRVSRKQLECAMQAETLDRMEICLL